MDVKTWQLIEKALDEILEMPPGEQVQHVKTSVTDPVIQKEILSLIKAGENIPVYLESGVDGLISKDVLIHNIADSLKDHEFEIDRYKITEELGRGGMSVVYRAHRTDGEFDQQVAVKIMQPFGIDREDRFRRLRAERQILAHLNHPNIATVFDGGITPEGWPYMVMEIVDGLPLTEYCNKHHSGLKERLTLFITICDAVNVAHQNLILHRDLKPGNILVTRNGQVKLLDFGIAKLLDKHDAPVSFTQTGSPLLTPEYAAPEQFRNSAATTAVDVYSLGVILYELLAGCRPFDLSGKSLVEINRIINEEDPEKPSEKSVLKEVLSATVKGDLDIICQKALRKEPENRYASVQDVKEDIIRFQTGNPISARPATARYRVGKFIQRHRTGVTVAAGFLLVLVSFIALLINQQAITAQERDRAVMMSVQVQAELDRSNTLREFLVDLFRANIPDRPQDELPTTGQLLEAGVDRALDPESGSPAIRADMLTVMASIYEPLNRLERALALTEEAIGLAETDSVENKDQLVAAWRLHSQISLRQRNINQAEESLYTSYRFLPPESRTAGDDLRLALDIARIRMQHGEYNQAMQLLLPYTENVKNGTEYPAALVNRLLWDMGIGYSLTNKFEEALEIRTLLIAHTKNVHGANSLHYAISLANTALTEVQLGRFREAEDKLIDVFELYDSIFEDQPSEYRGAALHTLARLQQYSGRFDQALATARLSSEQWAAATERENLDEYVWLHFGQAEILVAGEQWNKAEPVLEHTRNLFAVSEPPMAGRLSWAEANLARIHCQNNEVNRGMDLLSAIKHRLENAETEFMHTDDHLAFYTAGGICAMTGGQYNEAITLFNEALDLPIPPGQFATTARLHTHLATAMAANGQTEFAMELLNTAERIILERTGNEHPYLEFIENAYTTLPPAAFTQFE